MLQAGTTDAAPAVNTLDAWVPFRSAHECRYRVLGFPHAGGSAASYRNWRTFAAPGIDFCPVELPGRGSRNSEAPLTSLAELVARIASPIEPLLDVPFAFFGHSVGRTSPLNAPAGSGRATGGRQCICSCPGAVRRKSSSVQSTHIA